MSSGSHQFLDRVARQSVEEHGKKEDEEEPKEDLDDGPLVVVPDNVANRLDRVEEPHEGRVWASESTCNELSAREICLKICS